MLGLKRIAPRRGPDRRAGPTLALAAGLALLFGSAEAGAKRGAKTPRTTAATAAEVETALASLAEGDSCREILRRELLDGERSTEALADPCEGARSRAYGRLVRRTRPVFGVVDRNQESLARVSVVLSRARFCRRWLLRGGERGTLILADARDGRCSIRRFRGPLVVEVVDREGRRAQALEVAEVEDGRFVVRYAEVDLALRLRGERPLEEWSRIDLGEGGWGGSVDLEVVRRESAERHRVWVERGRGVPALFVIRHPDHPDADDVRLLAEEARLLRQRRDYQAVMSGEMTPQRFLDRYVVSRFHRAVEALGSSYPEASAQPQPSPAQPGSVCADDEASADECPPPPTAPPPDDPRP